VLGITRRHQGTDYAASPGTPVMAAGDGVVLRAGRAGGYGNLIELRHRNGITTRYGHLRGFARGIRGGARVSQGQTIGYVGSTGLASGPHLHYEFRVNGVAKDSRRVELGNGLPVPEADREAYEQERDRLKALLDGPPSGAIASAATDTGHHRVP
jgi:murein DD-endopeptidase MepM/ murein hydrolase activator NlpD